ncbi:hypothetical protein [Xanthomonas theicola]|uniref:hypothetical protein n=1 Tax=Xanthomonas theicola TaxID=56464 RepID=UPI000FF8A508|nr:hypothetical protein [Xanthomonas theicola]QNH24478.1 hypothetical protein G4Q83_06560 [Xanthomonas theicola]
MNANPKNGNHLPDEVLAEVAKSELTRSNQWLVGAFIAGIPSYALIASLGIQAISDPKIKLFFWLAGFLGLFVIGAGAFLSNHLKRRAIRTLCEIHARKSANKITTDKSVQSC